VEAQATPPRADQPLALERMDEIAGLLGGRRLALFLDYDGTLSPIVSRPEQAALAPEVRALVERLSRRVTLAIVSGRALADVRRLVGLETIAYAGNHGLEIQGPRGTALARAVGQEALDELAGAHEALRAGLETLPGVWVENKTHSLSVHYRQTPDERAPEVEAAVDLVLEQRPRLSKGRGKKVIEVRPRIDWDKGSALLWLLAALGLDGPDAVAVYVGDDATDEDAFRALAGRGIGVVVAESPRTSAAAYRVRGPDEVRRFLLGLEARLAEGTR
jgi:trehalose-phosphatase